MSNMTYIFSVSSTPSGHNMKGIFFLSYQPVSAVYFFCRVCFWRLPFCLDIFPLEMICVIKIFGHPICLTFLAVGPWKLKKKLKKCKNWPFQQPAKWGLMFLFQELSKTIGYCESWVNSIRKICHTLPVASSWGGKISSKIELLFFSKRTEKNPDFLRPSQRYKLDVIVFIVIYGMYHIKF